MAKYRKRPVVIEAWRFQVSKTHPEVLIGPPEWLDAALDNGPARFKSHLQGVFGPVLIIKTLEGTHEARPGDWIIRGVKGELYPCKPDIFAATYEAFDG